MNSLLKWTVSFVYLASTTFMLYYLFNALQVQSLGQGFERIRQDPWASLTLFDYLTGLCLSMPYLWITAHSTLESLCLCVGLFFMGNPLLLLKMTADLVFIQGDVHAVFFPRKESSSNNEWACKCLQWIATVFCAVYFILLIYVFIRFPIGDGWAYIKQEPWVYVTFLDNLLGILFTFTYILLREYHTPWIALIWCVALVFLGNGITCAYVVLATFRKSSLIEALLNPHPLFSQPSHAFERID